MSNNLNDDMFKLLMNKVNTLIDNKIAERKKHTDRTFPSMIVGVNPNGTYRIVMYGYVYSVENGLGTKLDMLQNVWVKVPEGRLEDMHICGVRSKKLG